MSQQPAKHKINKQPKMLYKKVENTQTNSSSISSHVENNDVPKNSSEKENKLEIKEITHSEKVIQTNHSNSTKNTPYKKQQKKDNNSNVEKKQNKTQNFKNVRTLSPEQRNGLDNLLSSFNDDHETNLILFLNQYMRSYGKELNKEHESVDLKILKNSIKQYLPKSLHLFNSKFFQDHKVALCDVSIVGNLYVTKKQSVLYVPNVTQYVPYFFKLYMFDILRKNIRIVNLYQNKPCTSIGMFAHYNYIGMPRAKFYELVKQIVTNEFRDHFYYTIIEKEKTDNLAMWDIHSYNFLNGQTDLKEGELIDNLPLMELKNRLVIIQHMNEMNLELWNMFLNDGKFPFIFDTEWNFFDPQEIGVRVIQVSNSFVCFMIMVDFEEKPAEYLIDFLINPKFVKIGFALNGDLKRLNNWFTKYGLDNIDRSFLNTPDYMNEKGWIEGDPFAVGLSKLVTFHTFSNQKTFYKFKGILEYYEYKWQPRDLNPTLTHCLKRIDYASMDVLIGYYYLKCEKSPSNHLFCTNLRMSWNEKTWKEEAKESKAIKYSLLDMIYSDKSYMSTTKTRHFKMKVAYTNNFWNVEQTIPRKQSLEQFQPVSQSATITEK